MSARARHTHVAKDGRQTVLPLPPPPPPRRPARFCVERNSQHFGRSQGCPKRKRHLRVHLCIPINRYANPLRVIHLYFWIERPLAAACNWATAFNLSRAIAPHPNRDHGTALLTTAHARSRAEATHHGTAHGRPPCVCQPRGTPPAVSSSPSVYRDTHTPLSSLFILAVPPLLFTLPASSFASFLFQKSVFTELDPTLAIPTARPLLGRPSDRASAQPAGSSVLPVFALTAR